MLDKVEFLDVALCLLIDSNAFLIKTIEETVCWPVLETLDTERANDGDRFERRGFGSGNVAEEDWFVSMSSSSSSTSAAAELELGTTGSSFFCSSGL